MRTPLNIALMGLNSVENDLMARLQDGNADTDEIQTIRDVKSAIVTAAEICTDLLDFDKVGLLSKSSSICFLILSIRLFIF